MQGRENESQARIRKFMTLMDSMTEKELDENNIKVLQEPSRIERIARGAGRHPNDMLELLGRPSAAYLPVMSSYLGQTLAGS